MQYSSEIRNDPGGACKPRRLIPASEAAGGGDCLPLLPLPFFT
jgi:hypothetical protein